MADIVAVILWNLLHSVQIILVGLAVSVIAGQIAVLTETLGVVYLVGVLADPGFLRPRAPVVAPTAQVPCENASVLMFTPCRTALTHRFHPSPLPSWPDAGGLVLRLVFGPRMAHLSLLLVNIRGHMQARIRRLHVQRGRQRGIQHGIVRGADLVCLLGGFGRLSVGLNRDFFGLKAADNILWRRLLL